MSFMIETQWIFSMTSTVFVLRHGEKRVIPTKLPRFNEMLSIMCVVVTMKVQLVDCSVFLILTFSQYRI